jgi:hypothetical protein
MANLKISELPEETAPVSTDILPMVDIASGATEKIAISTIRDTFVATTSVLGTVKMSVAPASAASPIAVGDNDGRIPTQGENDALAGSYGAPSSANKFVTASDANLTNNVKTTGDETIAGVKTFSSIPVLPASDPTTANQACRKSYVDGLATVSSSQTVSLGGQTITYSKYGKLYYNFKINISGKPYIGANDNHESNYNTTVAAIATALSKTLSTIYQLEVTPAATSYGLPSYYSPGLGYWVTESSGTPMYFLGAFTVQ